MKYTTQILLRGKTVHLFLRASDGPGAFTTSLRLDASFVMVSCVLQPDTAQLIGLAPGFEAQTGKPSCPSLHDMAQPRFGGQTGQTLLHAVARRD